MKVTKITDYYRGWFIGNFDPAVLKTEQFEVGLLHHPKGENWPDHYHKVAVEYNVLITGKMFIQDRLLTAGDVFVFEPGEIANPEFLEDCTVLCVKTPSMPGDKFLVQN